MSGEHNSINSGPKGPAGDAELAAGRRPKEPAPVSYPTQVRHGTERLRRPRQRRALETRKTWRHDLRRAIGHKLGVSGAKIHKRGGEVRQASLSEVFCWIVSGCRGGVGGAEGPLVLGRSVRRHAVSRRCGPLGTVGAAMEVALVGHRPEGAVGVRGVRRGRVRGHGVKLWLQRSDGHVNVCVLLLPNNKVRLEGNGLFHQRTGGEAGPHTGASAQQ